MNKIIEILIVDIFCLILNIISLLMFILNKPYRKNYNVTSIILMSLNSIFVIYFIIDIICLVSSGV